MDRIEEYKQSTRLNYSTLKTVGYNPKWIQWKINNPESEDDEKSHLRIGGALDTLLTNPEHFSKEYVTSIITRPSGYMGKFIESLPLNLDPELDEIPFYEEAYLKSGFKIPIEQVIKKFKTSTTHKEYFRARQEAQGRKVLSVDEYETVMFCKKELLNNPFTYKYFTPSRNTQIFFQVPIYFSAKGVEMKGMLDGILVDHDAKTVQPFDLKTTGKGTWTFTSEYISNSYFLQAAIYQTAFQMLLSDIAYTSHPRLVGMTLELIKTYTPLNMQFVVVPKVTTEGARIFQCTDHDLERGIVGGKLKTGRFIEGMDNLLDRFIWHTQNNKWDFPMEVYVNSGITTLDVYES